MKKAWIAFALSLIVPGAGLAYCGKWSWAAINLVLVTGVIFAALEVAPTDVITERIHYLIMALGAGSAGLAHAMAVRSNKAQAGSNVSTV